MPDPVTTVIGGASVVGGLLNKSASDKATDTQANIATTELQFEQNKYNEQMQMYNERKQAWEDMYGPIEKNLANSISSIDKHFYEVTGHTNLESQFTDISRRLKENFNARGITGSGMALTAEQQMLRDLAVAKAEVSSGAGTLALKDKLAMFESLGLVQKPNVTLPSSSGVANASTNLMNVAGSQAAGSTAFNDTIAKTVGFVAGRLDDPFAGSSAESSLPTFNEAGISIPGYPAASAPAGSIFQIGGR